MEGVGHRFDLMIACSLSGLRSNALLFSDNKAAANRKEYPLQEQTIINFHRVLAEYVGTGGAAAIK